MELVDSEVEPAFLRACEMYNEYAAGSCPEVATHRPTIDYPGELSYARQMLVTEYPSEGRRIEVVIHDQACESAPWSLTLTPLEEPLSDDPFEGDHETELCRSDGACMPANVRVSNETPTRRPREAFWLRIDAGSEEGSLFTMGEVKPCLPGY